MLEKLKPNEGGVPNYPWIDHNGTSWESKKQFLQGKYLGLCGCGDPDAMMVYVKEFLDKLVKQEWEDYSNLPYMFLCYWADEKGFTEHGSGIRCSWLTDKGKELLADINWCIDNEMKEEENKS